jgi:hypothetical protein
MKTIIYKIFLFVLLFGTCALAYGGNQGSPILSAVTNLSCLAAAVLLMFFYGSYPLSYKLIAWIITAGIIFLIAESLYSYNQYVYSFFVIKRFSCLGLAMLTYYVMTKIGPVKLGHIVAIILGFFFINQILLGQIFSYALTNDTRTTAAAEAFYLVFPFLFFLVRYITEHRRMDIIYTLLVLGLIFFLLHRSVISTAAVAGILVVCLSMIKKIEGSRLKVRSTAAMLFVLGILTLPLLGSLSPTRTQAFLETIGGIFAPSEDETGSWRLEQSTYYMTNFLDRPFLGWRYDGYDKGEIMENEDFPEKGTIIHSQYVDMLYNYGIAGMALNLLIIFCTMYYIYVRNAKLSLEQTVMICFIASGLLYGISYQLSPYYWSFVGLGMYYGGYKAPKNETDDKVTQQEDVPTVIQSTYHDTHSHSRS